MDKITTIKKWSPVLNVMDLDKEHYELASIYAEQHANLITVSYADWNEHHSTLPQSLKVLKILLDNNVKIKISDKPLETNITFRFLIEHDLSVLTAQEYYEHLAIEEISKSLIKKSNNGKIFIYKLIDRIESNQGYVTFYSNIKIINRKDKLTRILKENL